MVLQVLGYQIIDCVLKLVFMLCCSSINEKEHAWRLILEASFLSMDMVRYYLEDISTAGSSSLWEFVFPFRGPLLCNSPPWDFRGSRR